MPDSPLAPPSETALLARLFPKGGEMGRRIRELNWAATPLGPASGWPQSLRTAVSIMLGSHFPMMVHWGPDLVHFYNDGYAAILQGKHPGALGEPAEPWWREMWPFLLTIFTPVLAGQTTYFENSLVLPNRQGMVEEAYFTFSHSPIHDETGRVAGIFVTALETTTTVLHHRRLALLSRLTAHTAFATEPAEAAQHLVAALATNAEDFPFALLYTHHVGDAHADLRAWFGLPAGEPTAPTTLPLPAPDPARGWPVAQVLTQQQVVQVPDLAARFGAWPAGAWPEPPTQAVLLPLAPGPSQPDETTVLVLGLSARRPWNEDYRAFCALVADYAGRALARVLAVHQAQQLNQQLRALNASLDSFVHIVAHDLQGPATNLDGLLRAYHEESSAPARAAVMTLLQQEVQRLGGTVRGLLQVLQAQHTAAPMNELVAWAQVYATVRAELAEALDQAQGVVEADFSQAPTLRYPRAYVESLLRNLLSNALKYRAATRPPVVRVHTRWHGTTMRLTVADNGRGIDLARDGRRLFQPFARLTSEGTGAGLGLYLLQTLLQQRGGQLEVTSTPGVGTTFTATLREAALGGPR